MSSPPRQFDAEVILKAALSPGLCLLRLATPFPDLTIEPGQFVNVAIPSPNGRDPLLRRPFSVHRLLSAARVGQGRALEIMFKVVGAGTRALAQVGVQQRLSLLGPLGRGFRTDGSALGGSVLIGGGLGLAPLPLLAKALQSRNKLPLVLYGFTGKYAVPTVGNDSNLSYPDIGSQRLPEVFAVQRVPAAVACEEKRPGFFHGTVIDLLQLFLEKKLPNHGIELYACGPPAMLKRVAEIARERSLPAQVLLESAMGCGVGVCQSCVCRVRAEDGQVVNRRICLDGPAFDAQEVVWP